MDNNMDRVVPLDHLDDFKVADGEPDIRGWDVMASDGKKIGEVDNLLIDTGAMKVRYLDVDLDDDLIDLDEDRHVLIPIGYARLERDGDNVYVDALASKDVVGIPAYTHGALTRDYETSLRRHFDTGFTAPKTDDVDFYEHDDYDEGRAFAARREGTGNESHITLSEEQLSVGKRERSAGEVEINKTVDTEHVRETVALNREEVVIERRPATGGGDAQIGEEHISVPLTAEEAVVQKRVVPTEELVVKKQNVSEDQVVEADLRKERAEIHREGDVEIREDRKR